MSNLEMDWPASLLGWEMYRSVSKMVLDSFYMMYNMFCYLQRTWSVQGSLMMQGIRVRLEIVRGRSPWEHCKLHKD